METRQPYTFDRVVRIVIAIIVILAIVWLINDLSAVLLPFCIAWLLAYMMEPFVQFNRRLLKLKGRVVAVFMTLIEAFVALVGVCWLLGPAVIKETHEVATLLKDYATTTVEIPFLPAEVHQFLHKNIDFEQIAGYLRQEVVTNIVETATGLITGGLNFVLGIFSWFIVILYVVFIMLDYEKLIAGFKHMILPKYRKVVFTVANDVKNSMNRYFRGQALVAFIVGILFAIGFSIIGLPMAILLGLFIGLLNMVPYLQLISIIPTTVLCLVYSVDSNVGFWTIWWECMAVYVIVQVIQDFVLTPKIMGKAMGLNPAIILLSISVWGSLFGFIGLIIALPLTTLLISYYNRYISRRRPTPPSNPKDNSDKLPD
jgi:predicted PurR-regulated permease PerM